MKADMSWDGKLVITAKTPIESYALNKWFCNFNLGDKSSQLSVDCNSCKVNDSTKMIH